MAIYNPDGTPYKVSGSLQQFSPDNPEHDLFNLWDQEAIKIAGTPLYYYEIFINIASIDELYLEARDKIWSEHPIQIYGYYDPRATENYMSMFGADSPMKEMLFEFNYRHVLDTLGHPPKIGARLYSPHKRENWVVIQRNTEVYKMWGELRLHLMCERFQESLTTGEGKVTKREPDFRVNSVKDLGRGKMNLAGGQDPTP